MFKKLNTLFTAATTLLLFVALSSHAQKAEVDVLSPKVFKEKLEKTPDHVVLDVRTPAEVNEGMIEGAKMVDFNAPDFTKQIAALDKSKTYFVYCKAGVRSAKAIDIMKQSGFTHIHGLEGGYADWVKAGYPVVKP